MVHWDLHRVRADHSLPFYGKGVRKFCLVFLFRSHLWHLPMKLLSEILLVWADAFDECIDWTRTTLVVDMTSVNNAPMTIDDTHHL